MPAIHRDKETGKIVTNGSPMGAILEWVRWASQVILIPVLVAGFWWAASVQKFMWAGERYTSKDAVAAHRSMNAVWEARFNGLPPEQFVLRINERFEGFESELQSLKQQDQRHYEEVVKRLERLENLMMRLSK